MALINCGECGHEISDQAEVCPYCGARTETGKYVKALNNAEEKHKGSVKEFNSFLTISLIVTVISLILVFTGHIVIGAILWFLSFVIGIIMWVAITAQTRSAKKEVDYLKKTGSAYPDSNETNTSYHEENNLEAYKTNTIIFIVEGLSGLGAFLWSFCALMDNNFKYSDDSYQMLVIAVLIIGVALIITTFIHNYMLEKKDKEN